MNVPRLRMIWKIMLIFWLTIAVAIWSNIAITRLIVHNELEQRPSTQELWSIAYESAQRADSGDTEQLQHWFDQQARLGFYIIIRDYKYQQLAQTNVNVLADYEITQHAQQTQRRRPKPTFTIKLSSATPYIVQVRDLNWERTRTAQRLTLRTARIGTTFIIILLGSWCLARAITRPVNQLKKTSDQMARGDLSARTGHLAKRRDEWGLLAKSFDTMAARLQSNMARQRDLLRDVSHELRTPLTRQRLALALIKNAQPAPSQLHTIERQIEIMDALLDQMLGLLRSEQALQHERQTVDLVKLAREVVAESTLECEQKGLHINWKAAQQVLTVGDRELIRRAFQNLLSNAIQYSPPGGSLFINLTATQAQCSIVVEDEGPGVNENDLEKLAEAFFRAQTSTLQTGGFGIGLAIADAVARQHQGELNLRNRSEGGFSAQLILPSHSHPTAQS